MTDQTSSRRCSADISVQHIYAFFLVLARVTPLFLVAPVFSSQMLLPRVRTVIAVAIALGLTRSRSTARRCRPTCCRWPAW